MTLLPCTAAMAASARATTSKVTLEAFVPRPVKGAGRNHFSTTLTRNDASTVSDQIRRVMRESAQPVALITTFLPTKQDRGARLIHGATLSSFTSISLQPNLVCFSMKTPSKLADSLLHHRTNREKAGNQVDFVVNVLAQGQADLASAYAVPGTPPLLHPPPQAQEGKEEEKHPLMEAGLIEVNEGTVPVVKGALGAFGCQVVDTLDLSTYANKDAAEEAEGESKSILYIAKVLHVYTPSHPNAAQQKPLIYRKATFVSTSDT